MIKGKNKSDVISSVNGELVLVDLALLTTVVALLEKLFIIDWPVEETRTKQFKSLWMWLTAFWFLLL